MGERLLTGQPLGLGDPDKQWLQRILSSFLEEEIPVWLRLLLLHNAGEGTPFALSSSLCVHLHEEWALNAA